MLLDRIDRHPSSAHRLPICARAIGLLIGIGVCAYASAEEAPCAVSPAQLKAIALVPIAAGKRAAEAQEFEFAARAECLVDGSERRPALLLALGHFEPPLGVALSSLPKHERVLPPTVSVLDAQFRTIDRYDFARFRRRGTTYTFTLFLNSAEADGGYLLVTPDATAVGGKSTAVEGSRFFTVWTTGVYFGTYSNGSERRVENALEGGGLLRVALESALPPVEAPPARKAPQR